MQEKKETTDLTKNPLKLIRGNARACVILEPLFAIPHNMYLGYMSLYMLSFGISRELLGLITSLGLVANMIMASCSPYITDRMGRRKALLVFGFIGWITPLIIWTIAHSITLFIFGTLFNAFGYVTMNSFQCLLVEDSQPQERVYIFNFMQVASIASGFFAPVGGLLIKRYTLVPAMRIILGMTAVMMSAQFIIRHLLISETEIGKQKIEQMKGVKFQTVLKDYLKTLKQIKENKLLVLAILLRTMNYIQITIKNTFLSVLITERLGFQAETIAILQTFAAVIMLIVLIFVTPRLARVVGRWPIALGISFLMSSVLLILVIPTGESYFLIILTAILDALGVAITTPRVDALAANTIKNEERSVANSLIHIILLVVTVPFGYIGGLLSALDTRLPFVLLLILFIFCLLILRIASNIERKNPT